jgi:flagellar basal-body rod protein FlgG
MLKTLWNGRSGLAANQNRLDVISNNIANVNTNGYKKLDVSFSDLVYDKLNGSGNPITSTKRDGLISGSGSRADILTRDWNSKRWRAATRPSPASTVSV